MSSRILLNDNDLEIAVSKIVLLVSLSLTLAIAKKLAEKNLLSA